MDKNREIELRDVLIKHLRNAGIHVVTDREEGQSVLNDAGFTVRMQSKLEKLRNAQSYIRDNLKTTSTGSIDIEVPQWVNLKVSNLLRHKITAHAINIAYLNHAFNNHGIGGKKIRNTDIPLTKQDIELAPYILVAPDRIDIGTSNNGRESVIYEKTLSNGKVMYLEAEQGLTGEKLASVNMWANLDPHKIVPPFKGTDARVSTSPSLYVQNVILESDRAKIIKDAETAIRNEEILARADKLFVFSDKTVYGFVKNDTIYIDTNELNVETPIHEYAHLWAEALRQQNPKEWDNIVSIMKSQTEFWNKVKDEYPHLETDEEIADEVLATYSGQHGMQRLREECRNYKDGNTVLNRISAALDCFWKNVSNFFGIQYKSAEEVADRVFYDLLNEVNPLVYTKKGVQKLSDRMILGQINPDPDNTPHLSYEELAKLGGKEDKPVKIKYTDTIKGFLEENGMKDGDVLVLPEKVQVGNETPITTLKKENGQILAGNHNMVSLGMLSEGERHALLHTIVDMDINKQVRFIPVKQYDEIMNEFGREGLDRIFTSEGMVQPKKEHGTEHDAAYQKALHDNFEELAKKASQQELSESVKR